jgi:hypothetical protein
MITDVKSLPTLGRMVVPSLSRSSSQCGVTYRKSCISLFYLCDRMHLMCKILLVLEKSIIQVRNFVDLMNMTVAANVTLILPTRTG